MRFDDRLSTVLDGNFDSPRARVLRWQQLTDIVAQAGPVMPEAIAARALRMIALLSAEVPPPLLATQAAAIARQSHYAPLLVLLAGQSAIATEAVMPVARMSDDEWLGALPQIGPAARSLLRGRQDLSPIVVHALHMFAAGDMTIGYSAPAQVMAQEQPTDIRDLVRRIEEYRRKQEAEGKTPLDLANASERIQFVTDALGRIIDANARGRGRFIGIELGQPAAAFESGCDAGTARIISKRGRIESGRLLIQGDDFWSGTWLCEAEPRFAAENGAFRGYTGLLRRPLAHEVIAPTVVDSDDNSGAAFSAELLRQLMHELRSPLNAISGFAQLIEGQYAGPVAAVYLSAARTILQESDSLSVVIDEIDLLAQMSGCDQNELASDPQVDLREVLDGLANEFGKLRQPLKADFVFAAPEPIWVAADRARLKRLLHLWLQPLARQLVSDVDAQLLVRVMQREDAAQLTIEASQAQSPDASSGPMTSLGFAFAAAADLAREVGGSLQIHNGQHILNIPILLQADVSGERVG